MPLNNNRISWMINGKMFTPQATNKKDAKNQLEENFKASEWGPEAAEELCNEVRVSSLDFAVSREILSILHSAKSTLRLPTRGSNAHTMVVQLES